MLPGTIRILLIEDNSGDAYLIREMLASERRGNFEVEWVSRLEDGLKRLSRGGIEVVLLDLGLPDSQGLGTFRRAYAHSPHVPFVVFTGLADEALGVRAVSQGAQDYLIKGEVTGNLLLRAIRFAIERKRLEEALRQAHDELAQANRQLNLQIEEVRSAQLSAERERKRLFAVLDTLPAYVHLIGTDFHFQFANRRFREIFGEPGLRHCYEILRGRTQPCKRCRALEVLKNNAPQQGEWGSSLSSRTYEVYSYPFPCQDNRLVLTLGIDISERRQMEEALKESEERFRAIFESAAMGICLRDVQGRWLTCNPAFLEILGYSEEELKGKDFTEIIHPDDVQKRLSIYQELASGHLDRGQTEVRCRHKNGDYVWCRVTYSLVKGKRGKPLYVISMVEDVTEQKKAEENIRYLTHELIRTQEKEKHKISLELHDTVAQELVSSKISLENLRRDLPRKPARELSLNFIKLSGMLGKTLNSIRLLSYNLRPPNLEQLGLAMALRVHCEEVALRTGLHIDFKAAGIEDAHLDYETTINLFRIIQEGLNNVDRHAWAKNVLISLVMANHTIILHMEDDGQGFILAEKMASNPADRPLGLLGMNERVAFLGGKMHLESQINKGTKIIIEIPWSGEDHGPKEKAPFS